MKYSSTYNSKASILVLIEQIHRISNKIHQDTKLGGADTIYVNEKSHQDFIQEIEPKLNNRYKIVVDTTRKDNHVTVEYSKIPRYSGIIQIV